MHVEQAIRVNEGLSWKPPQTAHTIRIDEWLFVYLTGSALVIRMCTAKVHIPLCRDIFSNAVDLRVTLFPSTNRLNESKRTA
jgi:hypothetical protein